MIKEYYRPKTINEVLILLKEPENIILGGGTYINTRLKSNVNVVDIQDLELAFLKKDNDQIIIGSYTTLQDILLCDFIPEAIIQAITLDAPLNIRNSATLGGYLVTASGISALSTVFLALDATIQFSPSVKDLSYTEFITTPSMKSGHSLITSITIPNNIITFKAISYTPLSRPIICASLSTKLTGKTRLALGGYGNNPQLVFDGSIEDDIVSAARSAYLQAGDEWASSEYRSEMAATLTKRCISDVKSTKFNKD